MAAWFGHTQTLTSISKSVSTVASGIMGLEANLAVFMQKVTYYDKFFQRVGVNLPPEVIKTAARLFARCYEYRDEIRDELESSLAYVADAGRWVIGMEDWNSKMEKRLAQINELVLLSNTLLVEFTLTGQWGALGAKDDLDAYLRTIANSVVLQHGHTPPSQSTTTTRPAAPVSTRPLEPQAETEEEYENLLFPLAAGTADLKNKHEEREENETENPLFPQNTSATPASERALSPRENGELFLARSCPSNSSESGAAVAVSPSGTEPDAVDDNDDDDDVLNPFARTYQPPVSIESSLASLRAESENGSVYFNALESQQSHHHASQISISGDCDSSALLDGSDDGPDSPVSLGEYECLEIDSIPQYVAFKPSAMSRKRRLKQQYNQFFSGRPSSPSASVESLRSTPTPPAQRSPHGSPRSTTSSRKPGGGTPLKDRQRLMDLNYSYDFQRELTFNPFASPGMEPTTIEERGGGVESAPPPPFVLELSVPTVKEEEEEEGDHNDDEVEDLEVPSHEVTSEQVFGWDQQRDHQEIHRSAVEESAADVDVASIESLQRTDDEHASFNGMSSSRGSIRLDHSGGDDEEEAEGETDDKDRCEEETEEDKVDTAQVENEQDEEEEEIPHISASFDADMLLLSPEMQRHPPPAQDEEDELSRLLYLDESPDP